MSVDGYFEGPNHDISWHNVDEEFNKFAIEQLHEVDTILFGRRTYQLFEDYWPRAPKDPNITKDNLEIANLINNANKILFSQTLHRVEERENWKNAKLIQQLIPAEVKRWKEEPGKDMSVGGNSLCVSLAREGLVDELRLMVDPLVLGKGTPILGGLGKMNFKLDKMRAFASGNVLLTYRPDGASRPADSLGGKEWFQ